MASVDKIDMSLDDIIKLNKKEKKQQAKQQAAKPKINRTAFKTQGKKGIRKTGNNTATSANRVNQARGKQALKRNPVRGTGTVKNVQKAKNILQKAKKTLELAKKNVQRTQQQARQDVQMKKRGFQNQPQQRKKINRSFTSTGVMRSDQFVNRQNQQRQQSQRRGQWKTNKPRQQSGASNKILTVNLKNNFTRNRQNQQPRFKQQQQQQQFNRQRVFQQRKQKANQVWQNNRQKFTSNVPREGSRGRGRFTNRNNSTRGGKKQGWFTNQSQNQKFGQGNRQRGRGGNRGGFNRRQNNQRNTGGSDRVVMW